MPEAAIPVFNLLEADSLRQLCTVVPTGPQTGGGHTELREARRTENGTAPLSVRRTTLEASVLLERLTNTEVQSMEPACKQTRHQPVPVQNLGNVQ